MCESGDGDCELWEGCAETKIALSERYFDLVGLVVEGVGLRPLGLRASAASMSSGVKGLRMRKSLMLREPSGLR